MHTRWRSAVAQKVRIRATQTSRRGGELEVMLAYLLDKGIYCLDVSFRIGFEHDHTLEVGRHLVQTLDNLVDRLDEPAGRNTATLGHD